MIEITWLMLIFVVWILCTIVDILHLLMYGKASTDALGIALCLTVLYGIGKFVSLII